MDQKSLADIPFYSEDFAFAAEHKQEEEWKRERDIAYDARKQFEKIVNDNYIDSSIRIRKTTNELFDAIGILRTFAIVCSTINAVSEQWDKRYSPDTYDWARNYFRSDFCKRDLIVNTHPCLLNALVEKSFRSFGEQSYGN